MRHFAACLCLLSLLLAPALHAQRNKPPSDTLEVRPWNGPTTLDARPDKPMYKKAHVITFQHDWNGDDYVGELTSVRAVYTGDTLWLLYSCGFDSLTIGPNARPDIETDKLWERSDVAEAFIAPNPADIMRYKEFQVSPGGEWVDLAIDRTTMNHDPKWNSGFKSAARIDNATQTWWAEMAIPLKAFGVEKPAPGTRWRGNFYRWEQGPPKRPIAWQPTHQRDFHVPTTFGWLVFK